MQEHIDLINAILKDTHLNEAKQVTDSTLTAIMGREAAYSGAGVEWDTVAELQLRLRPGPALHGLRQDGMGRLPDLAAAHA